MVGTPLSPVDFLRQFSPETADSFQALRKAVAAAGPLDMVTGELVILAALVTAQSEGSFKVHARRLCKENVPVEAMRHAVLLTLAASTTFSQVISGLRWIDDVAKEP